MSEKPFRFKEFSISQDQCAMKVGTDSVLLGAWTHIDTSTNSVLDIGAGTGRDALWLGQQGFQVVAVEPVIELYENVNKRQLEMLVLCFLSFYCKKLWFL